MHFSGKVKLAGIVMMVIMVMMMMNGVEGHAVMRNPKPFNVQPTTQSPCGVPSITPGMQATPQATWYRGQPATVLWNLVASDGGGNVIGSFDPLGGTNFNFPAWDSDAFNTQGSNKFYNLTFRVPDTLNCDSSPSKLCTFSVRTTSRWYSCTMVKICGSECDAPPPPPLQCSRTNSLAFCPTNNEGGVAISEGYSASDIDSSIAYVYNANLNNSQVFATPKDNSCDGLYKNFLCDLSLPSCNPSSSSSVVSSKACRSQCKKAMKACSLTALHENLYDCDSLPLCKGESGSGGMSPGGAAALSIFIIALVASLAVAGFMYHKQGHLFGYTFDKDTKRVVKKPANPHNYTAYVDND